MRPPPTVQRRLALLAAALLAAAAAFLSPGLAANAGEITIQAVSHKSPFNCSKTFNANNWTGGHNPSNTIDWQNYGSDAINGENVRATAGGTAYFYNEGSTSYGKWVQIVHSDGTRTRYAHLATMVGAVGTSRSVSQGTVIGTVGSTGGSSAPHLHYEQRNASGSVVTPVVEGVQVPLGTKKAITSSNGCGGSNPYTPGEVCGSGYSQINTHALGTVGRIYLMYNASNGYNCVVTLKYTSVGVASAVSASLQVEGGTVARDSGNFAYYAGPVKKSAPNTCIKWGGSVGTTTWTSAWSHCG
ncbi:M23 family metallopeptidase [Glycomyces algeriensis]|uniref:Peptidase M23 n=1 Tax=Glycomyces algeriensis TaxID=256037 RepID=A0A9W6LH21_9ACTN|nr:M23 family metallopeptidase [Glycomyces algeriensis]MDA1367966.1 M23 family metallopeptidase [Glycomyces algeriensis]MDR7349505.1 murein DD-endopeptidase MepM/ murein hydrolase activator NlpD [Glycomyces algeriensis]GLI42211.1 peptidase M23 [Glycomyces algeriensis]